MVTAIKSDNSAGYRTGKGFSTVMHSTVYGYTCT